MKLDKAYRLVSEVASPSDAEGLKKERAILLLWFLRNVRGVDDLEAYEYICDGDDDEGVDGLYLEAAEAADEKEQLVLFQSKYPESPKNVGVKDIRSFIGSAEQFQSADAVEELMKAGKKSELERLIRRFNVIDELRKGRLEVRLVFVTAGKLSNDARRLVRATNKNRGRMFLQAYDVFDLAPAVEAFRSPKTMRGTVTVACDRKNRFVTTIPSGAVAVCRVAVRDIIKWPGIDDRSLFDLNVRRELGHNQVRKALDRAIRKEADHANFIAYHNGLTVVCGHLDMSDPKVVRVTDLSVVNGAQSTIAFKENGGAITDSLAVVVKFVEVPSEKQLAREVAIRSNTQNPVTARNLRARDGIQLRIEKEFREQYPDVHYETRPDASQIHTGDVIQNDDAAQLLCAVFNGAPWIAIRRLSLFEADRYPWVFTPEISASHVLLADIIGQRVQAAKARFPKEYLRSWRLTKLVAVYLVGQLLRTSKELAELLSNPASACHTRAITVKMVDRLVRFAAATLKTRKDEKTRKSEEDDFKVDFKREGALRELAGKARDSYLTYSTVEGS